MPRNSMNSRLPAADSRCLPNAVSCNSCPAHFETFFPIQTMKLPPGTLLTCGAARLPDELPSVVERAAMPELSLITQTLLVA